MISCGGGAMMVVRVTVAVRTATGLPSMAAICCTKLTRLPWIALLLLYLWPGVVPAADAMAKKNVFVLHSYSQEYPWTKRQHAGFVAAFGEDPMALPMVSTEYLDTKRHVYDATYAGRFADFLRMKYAGYRPDLIYVSDDNALLFALDHLDRVFAGVPVIFSGVNDYGVRARIDPQRVTGVFEKKELATNLELLSRLGASAREVILVGDDSSTDKAIKREAQAELARYPGIHATFIADEYFERVLEQLKPRSERFVLLTTIGGWKDTQGRVLPLAHTINALASMPHFGIITMEDAYMFGGVIGGHVTSGERQGKAAGTQSVAYLKGTPIRDLPLILKSPNEYLIDRRAQERHGLQIPEDVETQATILHARPSFYARERTLILVTLYGLAVALLLGGVVMVRLLLTRNRVLAAARDAAESASRTKSEFLASVSHELRTPLNAVLGYAQLIDTDSNLPEQTREQAQEIERAGRNLLSLVSDLIDLSRIEAGKLEFSVETVSVKALVVDSLALVAQLAHERGIALDGGVAAGEAAVVRVDYVRARQVLINFLSNAIKYNRSPGQVRVECVTRDGRVRVKVVDTGPGIPAQKQGRIFHAFDRLGAQMGTVEGTGIGLVIAKRLVEAMAGRIGFESEEAKGSTFWMEFDLEKEAVRPVKTQVADADRC